MMNATPDWRQDDACHVPSMSAVETNPDTTQPIGFVIFADKAKSKPVAMPAMYGLMEGDMA